MLLCTPRTSTTGCRQSSAGHVALFSCRAQQPMLGLAACLCQCHGLRGFQSTKQLLSTLAGGNVPSHCSAAAVCDVSLPPFLPCHRRTRRRRSRPSATRASWRPPLRCWRTWTRAASCAYAHAPTALSHELLWEHTQRSTGPWQHASMWFPAAQGRCMHVNTCNQRGKPGGIEIAAGCGRLFWRCSGFMHA